MTKMVRMVLVAEVPDDENLDNLYARVYGKRSLFGSIDPEFPNDAESVEPIKVIVFDSDAQFDEWYQNRYKLGAGS